MKARQPHSIYHTLLLRLIVFLILPFFTVSGVLVFRIIYTGMKSYQAGAELAAQQARSVRELHVQNVYALANRISTDSSLSGFLLVDYSNQNLHYYRAQMASVVSSDSAKNYRYSVGIFYRNETIPRGLDAFYYLSDLDQGAASEFLRSDETERWVLPCEAAHYTGAFTPYARHYTYLRKVFLNDALLYVLAISVPEREMDAFLGEASGFGRLLPERPEIVQRSNLFVVNYDGALRFDTLPDEALPDALAQAEARGCTVQPVEISGFPQTLVYLYPRHPQYELLAVIACLSALFVAALVFSVVRFIRRMFGSIYACLEAFEASVAGGFREKLPVCGDDEIARMARIFNEQIDKIQALMTQTADWASLAKESQLKALRQQINPHFLYNTLEVFSYRMELHRLYEEADAMVAFSNLLRYSIAGEEQFASLRMELAQTEHYMCIQRLKFPDLSFEVNIPPALYDLQTPRFLLQPIVENCFSHGYYGKPLHVMLNAMEADGAVCFEIVDNGKGLTQEELRHINEELSSKKDSGRLGIGLGNINARLCLYYSEACRVHVESEAKKWTMVTWRLPMEPYRPKGGEDAP